VVAAAALLTIAGLSLGFYIANRQRFIAQERFGQVHLLSTKVFDLDNTFIDGLIVLARPRICGADSSHEVWQYIRRLH
jgi:hypothetical protein